MGDFNHGNIKWDTKQSTGIEDQKCVCLVQDNFLTHHVLDQPEQQGYYILVLSSQKDSNCYCFYTMLCICDKYLLCLVLSVNCIQICSCTHLESFVNIIPTYLRSV